MFVACCIGLGLLSVTTGGFCVGLGLGLICSGIGIASGSGIGSTFGCDCVRPRDSLATMFSVGTGCCGSGIAALLTSVALIVPWPAVAPPQFSPFMRPR